jgi:NarL family two-component system response regulator LiaR
LTKPIHVLIVDNNPVFRAGISSLLTGADSGIKIVGEVESNEDVLKLIKQTQPHVMLMDISLARGKGEFDVLSQICVCERHPSVVIMIEKDDIGHIIQSLLSGAIGVVTKNVTADELRQAVYRAVQGQYAFSPAIIAILVDYLLQHEVSPSSYDLAAIKSLTDREREVFNLMAEGLSNKEIADCLSLCLGTVKSHVSNILGKLQVNSRAQAVVLLATGQFLQDQTNPKDEPD